MRMVLRDIMKKELITVTPEASIRETARRMKRENVGCILVTEDGSLKGILTDRDIACWVAEGRDPASVQVREIMKTDVVFSSPETDIFEASRVMANKGIRRLPLQVNGRLVGIVSISDLAPVLKEEIDNFLHLEEVYHH